MSLWLLSEPSPTRTARSGARELWQQEYCFRRFSSVDVLTVMCSVSTMKCLEMSFRMVIANDKSLDLVGHQVKWIMGNGSGWLKVH